MPERNASSGVGGRIGRGGIVSGAAGTAASGVALPSTLVASPGLTVGSGSGTPTAADPGVRVPSKLTAGERPTAAASKPMLTMKLDIRIARLLGRAAGMGHRAVARRSHLLGVFPQIS